jgi:transcriptional regulator with XRE-family HTH domain
MPKGKTIHLEEYSVFTQLLREARVRAALTQVQLAAKAGLSQPYVSSVERGGLRLDTLQLRTWLHVCGTNLESFGRDLEERLAEFERSTEVKKKAKKRRSD